MLSWYRRHKAICPEYPCSVLVVTDKNKYRLRNLVCWLGFRNIRQAMAGLKIEWHSNISVGLRNMIWINWHCQLICYLITCTQKLPCLILFPDIVFWCNDKWLFDQISHHIGSNTHSSECLLFTTPKATIHQVTMHHNSRFYKCPISRS